MGIYYTIGRHSIRSLLTIRPSMTRIHPFFFFDLHRSFELLVSQKRNRIQIPSS